MRIRNTFWGILVLLVGAIAGAIITNSGVYDRLIIFTALLIIVSWIWARLSIANIQIVRESRGERQQLGQIFEEQFTVSNTFPLVKPWIEIEDASEMISSGSNRVLSAVRPNSIRNYSGYTLLSKRGEYALSPTILYSGDPFGLFAFKKTIESNERLLVLPYLFEINRFPLPTGRLPGGSAVRRRTREVQPPNAAGIREYAPGDSLNRIHWPTTARRDRYMVKEFEQDPQADIWILLDAQSEVHIHAEEPIRDLEKIPLWWLHRAAFKLPLDTFEYAVSIAGSIARYFSRGRQVLGFACACTKHIILPSERGERQLRKILETLSLLNSEGNTPIISLIDSQSAFLPRGSTVILITPSVHNSLIKSVASLIRRGLNPLVILIDPSSFGRYYGTDTITANLKKWNVPCMIIKAGQDLKEVIESGFPETLVK
jgi:uncharacterized protein (DUF58 family)